MTASSLSRRSFMAPAVLLPLAAAAGPAAAARPGSRVLVAYFSRSGNTRVIAGQLKRALGAALFEIEPATAYPEDYLETVGQARRERDAGTTPALKSRVADIAAYDTVYLGFPIWGETAPPLIRSFLATHDLAGKTVIPFITHGGYGLGDSLAVLARHAPAARLRATAFVLQADQERQTMEKVAQWLGAGKGRG
ncbi:MULTISPECIES: flavodoxin [unclassified Massilia]|uniref:flavodoxin n=1 Tax=unclassified Massilia TaxID=2609279 RepID=UPI00177BE3EE|nr:MULTISPECIES: flavodoxin [unclassified Massilia]MBD8533281.1 flavodoxin [Massilia sp. CFBP 13647]MBD8676661.1 flavodoxin [Massilia sp. CFBP 13721]